MRRVLPLIIALSLAFAPAPFRKPKPDPTAVDLKAMQGEWNLASATCGVQVLPSAPATFALRGTRCRMRGKGVRNPWAVALKAEATPKQMTLLAQDDGHMIRAVYTLEGDTLTVCFDSSLADSRPATVSATGDTVRTWVFRRKKP